MPMTAQQQTDAYQFFVIAFGAAPGIVYMDQIDEAYTAGLTTQEIVNIYTTKSQFTARYPNFLTTEDFATSLVNNVVGNSASASAKAEAVADITAALNSGFSRGDVIFQVFSNLAAFDFDDETWGGTAQQFANQVAVAKFVTQDLLTDSTDLNVLRSFLEGVTEDEATVQAAKDAAQGIIEEEAANINLTVGADLGALFTGTGLADTFKANVLQNSLGQQVNSLGSGDELNGAGGIDTLNAKVTGGVFAGSVSGISSLVAGSSMPIQPETTSIEVIKFEAVNSNIIPGGGILSGSNSSLTTEVYINAKDMLGVTEIGSHYSDANLVIQNMTTLDNTGNARSVSDLTVAMEYTGNKDSRWEESDFAVYFDQDYLTPRPTSTNPITDILVMNEDAFDETEGLEPLNGVVFRELTITVNGVRYELAPLLDENTDDEGPDAGAGDEIKTYAELLAAVQEALVELKAANPTNAALQTVTADLGPSFFADVNPVNLEQREGTAIRLTMDGLTNGVINTLSVEPTDLELVRAPNATVENNNRFERADNDPSDEGEVLSINVELEKVGLAGDGGELIIGSMNKASGNVWDAVNTTTDTISGIEEFNVIVKGANDKSSSLSGLHSTNNNLRTVTVDTDPALTGTSFADLTIGNSNTDTSGGEFDDYEEALKDVQTFDASGFKGDLTLFAALTSEITDKYLNLVDEAPDAAPADNVNFEYTGGTGDDDFNITISANNGAFSGAVTREDFEMSATIDGGDGDDEITLAIIESDDDLAIADLGEDISPNANLLPDSNEIELENWYDNQVLNSNLRIDGGAGDDTIYTPGSGDVFIEGGTGNDTIYTDNTGSKSAWVFNAAMEIAGEDSSYQDDLDDIQSDTNESYQLFGATVRISYKGFEASALLSSTRGVSTDADINQAIKRAINNDAELSKLLVAQDGPANSLVVLSLIDGDKLNFSDSETVDEFTVGITAPTTLTAGDVSQLSSFYNLPGSTSATLLALFNTQIEAFELNNDYDGGRYVDGFGEDSIHTSDNTITGGLGDDVIVLGTGPLSNETLVYTGFGNGTDSIVNFSTDDVADNVVVRVGDSEDSLESFTVTFPTITTSANPASITFDGVEVSLENDGLDSSVRPAIDVAKEFADGYNAAVAPKNWLATLVPGTAQVEFVAVAPGNYDDDTGTAADDDVAANDFVFNGVTGTVAISNYVDGTSAYVEATPANFGVDLNGSAAIDNGTFAFSYDLDGAGSGAAETINVAYLAGDGPLVLANKFAAALNASGDWVATTDDDGIVEVEAAVPGELDLDTYVFPLTVGAITTAEANGLEIDVTTRVDEDGSDAIGTPGVEFTVESMPVDYLDFSSYNAVAVQVISTSTNELFGAAPALNQTWIRLTESTTNDGSYLVEQVREAGATDVLVGVVGTLDFGIEQDFVAANFII